MTVWRESGEKLRTCSPGSESELLQNKRGDRPRAWVFCHLPYPQETVFKGEFPPGPKTGLMRVHLQQHHPDLLFGGPKYPVEPNMVLEDVTRTSGANLVCADLQHKDRHILIGCWNQ